MDLSQPAVSKVSASNNRTRRREADERTVSKAEGLVQCLPRVPGLDVLASGFRIRNKYSKCKCLTTEACRHDTTLSIVLFMINKITCLLAGCRRVVRILCRCRSAHNIESTAEAFKCR